MAQRSDVDRLLASWLQSEADASLPSYLEETLELLDRTPRRRFGGWRRFVALERPVLPVPRPVLQLALLALLLLAALAAALIVGSQRRPAPPIGPAGNGQIAYSDGRVLYVVELDGQRTQVALRGLAADANPAFSPDGTMVAWFSRRDPTQVSGARRLFVARIDGSSQPRDVTGSIAVWQIDMPDVMPSWSPDGTRLAYTGLDVATGNVGIAIARVDGSGSEFVAEGTLMSDYLAPRWSPDGQWVSFSATERDLLEGTKLVLVRPDGTDRTAIATTGVRSASFATHAWSPDSTRVAYDVRDTADPNSYRVAIHDIARKTETAVSARGAKAGLAAWSPDGQSIAYLESTSGDTRPSLVVADVTDASKRRDLGSVVDCLLDWSPDSRYVLGYTPDGCRDELVAVPIDGVSPVFRIPAPGLTGPFSWQRVAP